MKTTKLAALSAGLGLIALSGANAAGCKDDLQAMLSVGSRDEGGYENVIDRLADVILSWRQEQFTTHPGKLDIVVSLEDREKLCVAKMSYEYQCRQRSRFMRAPGYIESTDWYDRPGKIEANGYIVFADNNNVIVQDIRYVEGSVTDYCGRVIVNAWRAK